MTSTFERHCTNRSRQTYDSNQSEFHYFCIDLYKFSNEKIRTLNIFLYTIKTNGSQVNLSNVRVAERLRRETQVLVEQSAWVRTPSRTQLFECLFLLFFALILWDVCFGNCFSFILRAARTHGCPSESV